MRAKKFLLICSRPATGVAVSNIHRPGGFQSLYGNTKNMPPNIVGGWALGKRRPKDRKHQPEIFRSTPLLKNCCG